MANFFNEVLKSENALGYLYDLDYEYAYVLVNDYDKDKVGGVAQGCFLIAFRDSVKQTHCEGLLLRVLNTSEIPQSKQNIESLSEFYIHTLNADSNESFDESLDFYSKNMYQSSGLKTRILGTFYYENESLVFSSDIANISSAHNYRIYKPQDKALEIIINQSINPSDKIYKIGTLHYNSNTFYKPQNAAFFLQAKDLIATRCAFFGMTRSGKSNAIKLIISALESINEAQKDSQKIGQIVFDINGEYTFANHQDGNICIFDKFKNNAIRFSSNINKVREYDDVRAIQYNFYNDETLEESFNMLVDEALAISPSHYMHDFKNTNMFNNENDERDNELKRAIYKCILYKAGFEPPSEYMLKFTKFDEDEATEMSLSDACAYFEKSLEPNTNVSITIEHKKLLEMISPETAKGNKSGYKVLIPFKELHCPNDTQNYKILIDSALREGKIVLVDLSSISTFSQQKYIDNLCTHIFIESLNRFTKGDFPEPLQMYFEEAHTIFTKQEKNLNYIYNRIAKEGAKLNIGISYATQEISSISSNILKNTQNFFIFHLNNSEEVKILKQYYDFDDFSHSIIRNKKTGFCRVKTLSNEFSIPILVEKFKG